MVTGRAWAPTGLARVSTQGPEHQLTPLGYHLRAAQVQINGITVILSQESCLDKYLRVIGTELKIRKPPMSQARLRPLGAQAAQSCEWFHCDTMVVVLGLSPESVLPYEHPQYDSRTRPNTTTGECITDPENPL